jgi:asparagine synthase (glutamine-hydrolysing)
VNPEAIEGMAAALSHRGPDGVAITIDGSAALGIQMMHITPEDALGGVPFVSHSLSITATSRLDNREELLRFLEIPLAAETPMTDARLILSAYQHWGTSCCEHLLGDFAFAIWDAERKALFCATDPMNVRTLYYARLPQYIAFASEVKPLLALPGVKTSLNFQKLAALPFPTSYFDLETTYYQDIFQIPKATAISISSVGIEKHAYWQIAPASGMEGVSDDEWIRDFRDLFFETIRCRLRSSTSVAALLSGGLDSSAIVAVAAQILAERGERLQTIAAIVPEDVPGGIKDERHYIEQFQTWENVDIAYIASENMGPFDDLERLLWGAESLWITSRHYQYKSLVRSARESGCRVMFDGIGGELGPTSQGQGYLAELLVRGKWFTLLNEIQRRKELHHTSVWHSLTQNTLRPAIPRSIRRYLDRRSGANVWTKIEGHPFRVEFLDRHLGATFEELAEKSYSQSLAYPDHRLNQKHTIELIQSIGLSSFVGYEHISWAFPFYDKRLLEFCLAAPGHLKVRNGWTRYLVRTGLDGILPPEIQWRTSKEPFSPDFHIRYNKQRPEVIRMLESVSSSDPVREVIDIKRLIEMATYEMKGSQGASDSEFAAMHMVPLGIYTIQFLRQFDEFRP